MIPLERREQNFEKVPYKGKDRYGQRWLIEKFTDIIPVEYFMSALKRQLSMLALLLHSMMN